MKMERAMIDMPDRPLDDDIEMYTYCDKHRVMYHISRKMCQLCESEAIARQTADDLVKALRDIGGA